ncbi:SRPBCC family protein [Leifsonia sp. NPDC058292]|uniref:SRPBCC family protein n=1 Tax=Leifsonia sp. NPDC058292 TaxID=3346428 RepID=UPI0036D89DCB
MATITREIAIDATPEAVWEVVSDFVGGPMRMAGSVFTDCRLTAPDTRRLTFADGTQASERFVARDDARRRMVWSWAAEEVVHDSTSMQVFPADDGCARLMWTHDTLPDELSVWLGVTMDELAPIFQRSLARPTDAASV